MVTAKEMAINHLNSSGMIDDSHKKEEALRMIKKSKEGDNPFLAARFACFPSVLNSKDYLLIVNKALHTNDNKQLEPTIIFLSRHGEHTNNPDYATNIDTVNLLLSSKSWDQAYYRGQMATHLANDELKQKDIHNFMCLIRKNKPFAHYSSLMQIYLTLDEEARNRLLEEIKGIEETFRVDYILQYTMDSERYDSNEKLKLLVAFIREIKGAKTEEEAKKIYRTRLKSICEIDEINDTIEYRWGELISIKNENVDIVTDEGIVTPSGVIPPGTILNVERTTERSARVKGHHN